MFGNENDGLSTTETDLLRDLVRIPTSPEQPSINLGTAVALVLCELFDGEAAPDSRKNRPLDGRERERLKDHLRDSLSPRIRGAAGQAALRRSIDRVFSRAPLETRDAQAWHKLLRELDRPREE